MTHAFYVFCPVVFVSIYILLTHLILSFTMSWHPWNIEEKPPKKFQAYNFNWLMSWDIYIQTCKTYSTMPQWEVLAVGWNHYVSIARAKISWLWKVASKLFSLLQHFIADFMFTIFRKLRTWLHHDLQKKRSKKLKQTNIEYKTHQHTAELLEPEPKFLWLCHCHFIYQ